MLKKIFMVSVIIVLVLLIIITPRFIGRDQGIAAVPELLVDHVENQTKVYVKGIGDYRYPNITIQIIYPGPSGPVELLQRDTFTYFSNVSISDNLTKEFDLNVSLYVGKLEYQYNCSISIVMDDIDPSKTMMEIREKDGDLVTRREDQVYKKLLERVR